MTTTQPKGWSGLDARQVVHQSTLIHPDWDPEMHAWYLSEEEGINLEHLRPNSGEKGPLETIARWAEEVRP